MTGLDMLLLILIVTFIYLGYRRGVIGEAFDIITGIVTGIVGVIVYAPLGKMIDQWTEWGIGPSQWLAFFLVGCPVAVSLLILGMHLDRISRDDKKIPDAIMAYGGLLLSIFKSLFVLWLALMLLKASPLYSKTTREEFANAPVVNFIEDTGGTAGKAVFGVMAPGSVQKQLGPFLQSGF